eukprot:scaffold142642_cov22-Tisochrysis_lutea.AAC.1
MRAINACYLNLPLLDPHSAAHASLLPDAGPLYMRAMNDCYLNLPRMTCRTCYPYPDAYASCTNLEAGSMGSSFTISNYQTQKSTPSNLWAFKGARANVQGRPQGTCKTTQVPEGLPKVSELMRLLCCPPPTVLLLMNKAEVSTPPSSNSPSASS